MRNCWRTWTIATLMLGACATGCITAEERAEREAASVVARELERGAVGQIGGGMEYCTGPLDDGRAVLVANLDAAFWVKDCTVYVVNDRAKAIAPNLEQAPPEITYEAVVEVAD